MKKTLTVLTAAIICYGCVQKEILDAPGKETSGAISFSTYLGAAAQTKAIPLTNSNLGQYGFGVQAYYTGMNTWTEFTGVYTDLSTVPAGNVFMNNTKVYQETSTDEQGNVTITGTSWQYSPLKYWPNSSEERVSFFAYAPHSSQSDKIALSGTSIEYTVSPDVKEQVDLLYHKNENSNTKDLHKQGVGSTVNFKFEHALAQIGFKVAAATDILNSNFTDGQGETLAEGTTIELKKVALIGAEAYTAPAEGTALAGPFHTKGTLDITSGTWTADATTDGTQGFEFTAEKHFVDSDSDNTGNAVVLDSENSNTLQPVLAEDSYLMVIPQTFTEGNTFKVYVEYDVITVDAALTGGKHTVNNKITSEGYIPLTNNALAAGKAYTINLILGMTSAKFSANVEDWTTGSIENSDNPNNAGDNAEKTLRGKGTSIDPYIISNTDELVFMRDKVNAGDDAYTSAYYKQTENIDLSTVCGEGNSFSPIGNDSSYPFSGKYDGQGKSVTGLYINDNTVYSGLFGRVTNAVIKDISVAGEITKTGSSSAEYAGGIVGYATYSTISGCTSEVAITGGDHVGGIVGMIEHDNKVIGCVNKGNLVSGSQMGGITGHTYYSGNIIVACYNTGNVSKGNDDTTPHYTGGIVGYNSSAVISACYNTGDIYQTSSSYGGISGSIFKEESSVDTNYYGGNCTLNTVCNNVSTGNEPTECYKVNNTDIQWHTTGGGESSHNAMDAMNTAITNLVSTVPELAGWSYEPCENTNEPLKLVYTAPAE